MGLLDALFKTGPQKEALGCQSLFHGAWDPVHERTFPKLLLVQV